MNKTESIKALELGDIVLEILKYISSKQLLSTRKICKQWDGLARLEIRKRRDIMLSFKIDAGFHPEAICIETRNREFIKYLQSAEDLLIPPVLKLEVIPPYGMTLTYDDHFAQIFTICEMLSSRGKIRELVIDWNRPAPSQRTASANILDGFPSRLVKILGSLSKTLEALIIHTFPEVRQDQFQSSAVEKSLEQLILTLPSLQVLTLPGKCPLSFCSMPGVSTTTILPLKFILNSCPNLKSIEALETKMCQDVMELLGGSLMLERIRSLKLYYLDEGMTDKLLASGNLSLDELVVRNMTLPWKQSELRQNVSSFEKLAQLLQRVKHQLKNIDLRFAPYLSFEMDHERNDHVSLGGIFLPGFCSLRKLSLHLPSGCDLYSTVASLNFPLATPVLEAIELGCHTNIHAQHFDIRHVLNSPFKCVTVKELLLDNIHLLDLCLAQGVEEVDDSRNSVCHWLQTVFPNVEKLVVRKARKFFLQHLWTTEWKLLELEISFWVYFEYGYNEKRDFVLFSLSEEVIEECAGMVMEEWWEHVHDVKRLTDSLALRMRVTPTLCNLKSLRRLKIVEVDSERACDWVMSNLSVYFGLGLMKQLRTIEIGDNKIDREAVHFLLEILPELAYLTLNYGKGLVAILIKTDIERNAWRNLPI